MFFSYFYSSSVHLLAWWIFQHLHVSECIEGRYIEAVCLSTPLHGLFLKLGKMT